MNILRMALFVGFTLTPASLSAQKTPAAPMRDAADSAAAARGAYRLAREALSRGDTAAAVNDMLDAARAWPLQPEYPARLLELALHRHDMRRVAAALQMGNDIGVPLRVSPAAIALSNVARADRSLRPLWEAQERLRTPVVSGRTFRILSDSTLFPESITVDPRNGTLYVSSIRHGNVLAVAPDAREGFLLTTAHADIGGIFGIAVDTTRGVLWAASAPTPAMMSQGKGSAVAALISIRLRDGALMQRIGVPTGLANASPGDITVMPNGDVLIADSQAAVLWWLQSDADTLVAIRHHLFRSLQGIVTSKDSRFAWVADYSHGLLRVQLGTSTVMRVADLRGHTLVGLDGMVRFGDSFVAVQNGFEPMQVVQFTLDATGTRVVQQAVLDRNPVATSPTGGVIMGDQFVYIANSLWDRLDATGNIAPGVDVPKPLLLSVPLRR